LHCEAAAVTTRRTQRFRLPRLYHRFEKIRGKSDRWNSDATDNERTRMRDRDNWPKKMRPHHSHAKQTRAAKKVHAHTYHTQTHIRRSGVVFRDLSYLTVRREIMPEQRQPPPPTATAATRRPPMTPGDGRATARGGAAGRRT
jgi:ribosomal protein L19E